MFHRFFIMYVDAHRKKCSHERLVLTVPYFYHGRWNMRNSFRQWSGIPILGPTTGHTTITPRCHRGHDRKSLSAAARGGSYPYNVRINQQFWGGSYIWWVPQRKQITRRRVMDTGRWSRGVRIPPKATSLHNSVIYTTLTTTFVPSSIAK